MTTCVFTEADRLGKRKDHQVGFPGLACRHCYGGNGSGRFFPLTLKTFSDVSKSIHVLRNHLVKCARIPKGMADTVNMLYERHKDEKVNDCCRIEIKLSASAESSRYFRSSLKQSTPFGSQKIFFDLVWRRLHPELSPKKCSGPAASAKKSASKPPRHASHKKPATSKARKASAKPPSVEDVSPGHMTFVYGRHVDEGAMDDTVSLPDATNHGTPLPPLPSPPVIHRGKLGREVDSQDDARLGKEHCMIPKKRYLNEHRPDLPPRYPSPPLQYTESDMSVAMILANLDREEASKATQRREEV